MTRIFPIPTSQLGEFWDELGPFIDKAASRYSKEYDLSDVWDALLDERALLFGIWSDGEAVGAMTVAPVEQPKRKTLVIELVAGQNAEKWYADTVWQLKEFARRAGYDAITSNARKGWRKMANSVGFKEASTTYEMDLN